MLSSAMNRPHVLHFQPLKDMFLKGHIRMHRMRYFNASSRSMIKTKSSTGLVCGEVSTRTLVPDPHEEAEIAVNMAEVAEIERAEKEQARVRAAHKDEFKQGLAQVLLREQPNIQPVRSDTVTKEIDSCPCEDKKVANEEEYLRTEYDKNFHKDLYDLKYFYDAARK